MPCPRLSSTRQNTQCSYEAWPHNVLHDAVIDLSHTDTRNEISQSPNRTRQATTKANRTYIQRRQFEDTPPICHMPPTTLHNQYPIPRGARDIYLGGHCTAGVQRITGKHAVPGAIPVAPRKPVRGERSDGGSWGRTNGRTPDCGRRGRNRRGRCGRRRGGGRWCSGRRRGRKYHWVPVVRDGNLHGEGARGHGTRLFIKNTTAH